jgi:hypothetical protein
MRATYTYNHSLNRHRLWRTFAVFIIIAAVIGLGWLLWKQVDPVNKVISGATVYVPQTTKAQLMQTVEEPLFAMQLPIDWRQTSASATEYSWQSTLKGNDNRYLSVYVDKVPSSLPVDYELPLMVNGNQLMYSALSDNCVEFTPGGTLDVGQAEKLKPAPSVWQGVNFICNLPQVVDDQVGTGSVGNPINSVAITGPNGGTHNYFFLYIDRNAQPDYSILYNAVQSFHAK